MHLIPAASTAEVAIEVDGIAPVVNAPASQTVNQNILGQASSAYAVPGLSIVDASLGSVDVTLTVSEGTLELTPPTGSSPTIIGNDTPMVIFSGDIGVINCRLGDNGLSYSPVAWLHRRLMI